GAATVNAAGTHESVVVGPPYVIVYESDEDPGATTMHISRAASMAAILLAALAASPAAAGNAVLNLVLVLDGLRPDSITPEETPTLWRLRQEGVNFINSHSVFPTVTRVNATAIATGLYPDRNGIFGNTIYVREVDPNRAFGNDDHRNLLRLDAATGGRMVLA